MIRKSITLLATLMLGISGLCATIDFPAAEWVSGTLPVLYITTEDSLPVTSKEEYLQGTYYLDPMGCEGVEAIGNHDEQLALEIKGRGNASWKRVKKPYRLKLGEKAPLLGMRSNRHWCLLTEWRDGRGRLTWETGFYVSRMLGLQWTPGHQPVELVLNGDYQGLYFLTEKIRVSKHRVNITEQDDMETDPDLITGGWLCEIDNYDDTPQVYIMDRNTDKYVRTTIHSPEALSMAQRNYIQTLVGKVDAAIYCKDKTNTDWEELVDLDMLARFYLTNEILYNIECFGGSCYWSKERGDDTKIMFGPVWDFDQSCMAVGEQRFCYVDQLNATYTKRNRWIDEIVKFPRFMQRVRELWQFYNDSVVATVEPHAIEWTEHLRGGADRDILRWYDEFGTRGDLTARRAAFLARLRAHHKFLATQWAKPLPVFGDANADGRIDSLDVAMVADRLLGRDVAGMDTVNANAYCDDVLDLSDLVGIVRQSWLSTHPGSKLPTPRLLPYGQSDKATDNRMTLALPDGDVEISKNQVHLPVCVIGPTSYSALQFDARVDGGRIVGVTMSDGAPMHRIATQPLDGGAMRVLMWSDSLAVLPGSASQPRLWLEVELDNAGGRHSVTFDRAMLAEADMFPHCLTGTVRYFGDKNTPGDLNGDDIIDIDDVNLLINILLGKAPSLPEADIDTNGVTDIDDLNLLINLMLG